MIQNPSSGTIRPLATSSLALVASQLASRRSATHFGSLRSPILREGVTWCKSKTACTLTAHGAAFAADFIAFPPMNTREMKLFGVSSLLRCAFFRIRLGIPGVIACSTFASNLFLLFGGNILC